MGIQQGEIIWMNFKFTDGSGEKIRPALVISNSSLEYLDEIIMLKITSVKRNDGFDYPLSPEMLLGGELAIPESLVRLNTVQSISTLIVDQKKQGLRIKRKYLERIIDRFMEQIELE